MALLLTILKAIKTILILPLHLHRLLHCNPLIHSFTLTALLNYASHLIFTLLEPFLSAYDAERASCKELHYDEHGMYQEALNPEFCLWKMVWHFVEQERRAIGIVGGCLLVAGLLSSKSKGVFTCAPEPGAERFEDRAVEVIEADEVPVSRFLLELVEDMEMKKQEMVAEEIRMQVVLSRTDDPGMIVNEGTDEDDDEECGCEICLG